MGFMDDGVLPAGKFRLRARPNPSDDRQYLLPTDWNTAMAAVQAVRLGVIDGKYLGLAPQASRPTVAGDASSKFLWIRSSDAHIMYFDGTSDTDLSAGGGGSGSIGSLFKIANDYAGSDIGQKINAAVADLGSVKGTIYVLPGNWSFGTTQTTIGAGQTLVLGNGYYDNAFTDLRPVILMKDGSSLIGYGAEIKEALPIAPGFSITISDWASEAPGHNNSGVGGKNLLIDGITISRNPDATMISESGTIYFGNVENVTVRNCTFDRVSNIGLAVGGASDLGNHAKGIQFLNNKFLSVDSQNVAIVNGINALIDGNYFLSGGAGGSTFVDLELNTGTDILQNVVLSNNVIDSRGGLVSNPGAGIQIAGSVALPGLKSARDIIIKDNVIIGGDGVEFGGSGDRFLTNGINVALAANVQVVNNDIRYCGQSGITINASDHCTIALNRIQGSSPSGEDGSIYLTGAIDCDVHDNVIATLDAENTLGGIYEKSDVLYTQTSDYNQIHHNRITTYPRDTSYGSYEPHIRLTGTHSRAWANAFNDDVYDGPGGVDTVAKLASGYIPGVRASGVPALAQVMGQSSRGDLQPLNYYYDPVATDTADTYTAIKPPLATNGRWKPASQWLKLTTTQRDAMTAPQAGLIIWNTTTSAPNYFDGSAWQAIGSGGGGTITTSAPLQGDGSGGSPVTVDTTKVISARGFKCVSSTPAGATGTFNGGGSISVTGNNEAGHINIATGGTLGSMPNDWFTITLADSVAAPNGLAVEIMPADEATSQIWNGFNYDVHFWVTSTTTAWTVHIGTGGTGPSPIGTGGNYIFNYVVRLY